MAGTVCKRRANQQRKGAAGRQPGRKRFIGFSGGRPLRGRLRKFGTVALICSTRPAPPGGQRSTAKNRPKRPPPRPGKAHAGQWHAPCNPGLQSANRSREREGIRRQVMPNAAAGQSLGAYE